MRRGWFVGVAFVTGLVAGCGGTESGTACPNGDSDCPRGQVCGTDKTCEERTCTSLGDCSGTDQLCVAGDLLGKDETKKYCTSKECGGELKCAAPNVCEGGLCVAPTQPDDVVETDNGTPEDNGGGRDESTPQDVFVPPVDNACKACAADGDCDEGSKCTPVGASKHCLPSCTENAQCPKGFICYAASSSGKACLPVSYNCVACIAETPCGENDCCDFLSGSCKPCKDECQKCSYDFECGTGMRCLKTGASPTGVCVDECSDAKPCADTVKFACTANEAGVKLCTPTSSDTCAACPQGQFPSTDGQSCWECRNSADCKDSAKPNCNMGSHTCTGDTGCQPPLKDCSADPATPKCQSCCADTDCPEVEGQAGKCKPDGTCVGGVDPCGNACEPPFAICEIIGGQPQCVQCSPTNDQCGVIDATCKCNTASYTCLSQDTGEVCNDGGVGACSAICSSDADCPPSSEGAALSCYTQGAAGGFCYDPAGACDGISSCCGAGQDCLDLIGLLFGGLMGGGGGMPGMPSIPSGGAGYCSCDDTHPCLGGQACQDLGSILALLGPLLGLPTGSMNIPKMCGNPLGGLGI